MKKFKSVINILILTMMPFASTMADVTAPTPNLCSFISDFYTGTYVDTTGLFPSQPFPISTYLVYQNGMIYGYTLPADDQKGAGYGQTPYALIWGKCANNQITDLYIIKNTRHPCGDPAPGPMPVNRNSTYQLSLNYENAMINANLLASLAPNPNAPHYSLEIDAQANASLIQQAMDLATKGIPSCH